jgi:anti-sigma factor (TIGR02949 family)
MTAFWKWGKRMGDGSPPPGGIDCGNVMDKLYEYLDQELDDEMIVKIREHLTVCKRCFPRYNFERAFLRFLAEQGRVKAPPELRRKVFAAILEEERED